MENPSREPQQSGEKKPQAGGSQVLLYMLLIATAAGFFALFFNWQNAVVFDYQEFEDLVKQQASGEEPQGFIEINRGTEKKIRISGGIEICEISRLATGKLQAW